MSTDEEENDGNPLAVSQKGFFSTAVDAFCVALHR